MNNSIILIELAKSSNGKLTKPDFKINSSNPLDKLFIIY